MKGRTVFLYGLLGLLVVFGVVTMASGARYDTAPDKVVVYMRHDIDVDPATALRMAGFETGARVSLLTHPIHWGEPLTAPGAVPAEAPPAAAAGAAAGH